MTVTEQAAEALGKGIAAGLLSSCPDFLGTI